MKTWYNVTYSQCGDITVLASSKAEAEKKADELWVKGVRPQWTNAEICSVDNVDTDEQADMWRDQFEEDIEEIWTEIEVGDNGQEFPETKDLIKHLIGPVTETFTLDDVETDVLDRLIKAADIFTMFPVTFGYVAYVIAINFAWFVVDRHVDKKAGKPLVNIQIAQLFTPNTARIALHEAAGNHDAVELLKMAKKLHELTAMMYEPLDDCESDIMAEAAKVIGDFSVVGTENSAARNLMAKLIADKLVEAMNLIAEHRGHNRE